MERDLKKEKQEAIAKVENDMIEVAKELKIFLEENPDPKNSKTYTFLGWITKIAEFQGRIYKMDFKRKLIISQPLPRFKEGGIMIKPIENES